jgi:surface antigen
VSGPSSGSAATKGSDDYPTSIAGCRSVSHPGAAFTCDLKNAAPDTLIDPWGEYNRECTSFVAWRLHSRNGFEMPFHDNALGWGTDASGTYPVNKTPAVGAVAWWNTGKVATSHVAWVEAVSGSTVTIEEYNAQHPYAYDERNIAASSPTDYIHFHDLVSSISDGSFVSYQGNVYRIAGGAPVYVSTWNVYGGPQPATALTAAQWNALNAYPADGTFVAAGGFVYRIAGGAPVYVSTWNAVGGPHAYVEIDPAAVINAGAGSVWNHLRQYPADGTFVAAGGYIYRMAGGAPIYVSNWNNVGGPQPSVEIDAAAVGNAGGPAPWNHLLAYPADGTFVAAGGYVYRIAGGAPIYVSSWGSVGGQQPSVEIDPSAISAAEVGFPWNHLRQYPLDGTFVIVLSGAVYRIAGGAAIYIDSWAPYGGVRPTTLIDQAAINSAGVGVPWNHLTPKPADGTILQGLPSNGFWKITGGKRAAVALPQPIAVAVPDDALVGFPLASAPPKISSFSPATAGVGSTVTLTGSNLTGTFQLTFNGTAASSFHVVSAAQVAAVVPAGASSGAITVVAPGGSATSTGTFSVIPAPTIASFSPASAIPGSTVTITGAHFTGVSAVIFNGVKATFHFVSDTSIAAAVPPLATSGPVSVTTPGGASTSGSSFTVLPFPSSVLSFTPAKGPIGTHVTISGAHFAGATAVKFNGTAAATFKVVSDDRITVTVPAGATSGKIAVVGPGGTATSSGTYTVT